MFRYLEWKENKEESAEDEAEEVEYKATNGNKYKKSIFNSKIKTVKVKDKNV